jgi:hypothetical protein
MLLTAALSVVGVTTGVLAARLADLHSILVPVSAVALGVAHSLAHQSGGPGQRRQQIMLWTATVLSVSFWVVPSVLR